MVNIMKLSSLILILLTKLKKFILNIIVLTFFQMLNAKTLNQ